MTKTVAVLAPSPIPFVVGGAENLWTTLVAELNETPGIQADLIKIPTRENTVWAILDSYRKFAEFDLNHFDTVIVTKYPAWMLKHSNKVLYLQHKLRGLYDTWPQDLSLEWPATDLFNDLKELLAKSPKREYLTQFWCHIDALKSVADDYPKEWFALPSVFIRQSVHWLDAVALNTDEVKLYSTLSQTVASRKDYFPQGVKVHVLAHPSGLPIASPQASKAIFTASRHDAPKRLDVLVKAYRKTKVTMPLRIAGEGPQTEHLKNLANNDSRIQFLGRIDSEQLALEYAQALFVPFIPHQEDLGLITLEAFLHQKPVMTFKDSGGAAEIVQDQINGWVLEPTEAALEQAIHSACTNIQHTENLGRNAPKTIEHISWKGLIQLLLQPKPKLLLLNTYSLYPAVGGGQLRTYQLYRYLSKEFDIIHLALVPALGDTGEIQINPSFKEIRVPRSLLCELQERELGEQIDASVGDVSALLYDRFNPAMSQAIQDWISQLDMSRDHIILSHPYMYKMLTQHYQGSFIYEAHNVEADLKQQILKQAPELIQLVRQTEQEVSSRASHIIACSQQDAERLEALYAVPNSKIDVIPNGTDTQEVQPIPLLDKPKPITAIFMGSYHGPNNEALEHIIDLAKAASHLRFIVMGSVIQHFKKQGLSAPDNLLMTGVVSNRQKHEYLAQAHIALNPITSGSGTNLKMLEYAAAGLIILSTPFGGRGGILQEQKHFYALSIPEMQSWLADCDLRKIADNQHMVINARKTVEEKADWRILAKNYQKIL